MPDNETPGVAAPAETPAPVADAAPAAGGTSAPEWDGSDWTKLDSFEWWKAVPESARTHITKAHEERTSAKERSEFLDRLFNADDDKLRTDHAAVLKERDELRAERDFLKEALTGIETRAAEEAEEREYQRIVSKYADIHADFRPVDPAKPDGEMTGAWVKFCALVAKGVDEDDAADLARKLIKPADAAPAQAAPAAPAATEPAKPAALPKTREVEAPKAVKHASPGGNSAVNTRPLAEKNASLDAAARRLQAKYEEEERALLR